MVKVIKKQTLSTFRKIKIILLLVLFIPIGIYFRFFSGKNNDKLFGKISGFTESNPFGVPTAEADYPNDGQVYGGDFCGGGGCCGCSAGCANSSCDGGGGGGGGGGCVICTELNKAGYISDDFLEAEHLYMEEKLDEIVMLGYHSWAKPFVRFMKKSDKMKEMTVYLGKSWAKHLAYKMNYVKKDDEIGKAVFEVGFSFCSEIGQMLYEKGLNDYEFSQELVEKLATEYFLSYQIDKDKSEADVASDIKSQVPLFFAEIKKELEKSLNKLT